MLSGVLIIDKPLRLSSMQVVARVRRRVYTSGGGGGGGRAKTGHAGTLDPLATGVLVIAIGKATKIIERLMATDKRYRTTIDLSAFTTTDDREGEREEVEVTPIPTPEAIDAVLRGRGFRGEIMQRPPAFSAMKVGGRRAYALARKGESVEIPPRPVVIHSIRMVEYDWPLVTIDVRCGKGTYIRSLARDLGRALGTGGHCAELRRTAVGPFDLSMARELDALPEEIEERDLIRVDEALAMVEAAPPTIRHAKEEGGGEPRERV